MVLYEYECKKCLKVINVYQSVKDDVLTETFCESCGKTVPCDKIITSMNFKALGDGWSKTGYDKNHDKLMAQI